MQNLVSRAEEFGVEYDEEDFQISKDLIAANFKTEIASLIWDEKGLHMISNETNNEVLKEALDLFNQAKILLEAD